ncbi:MAG TPA: hypothetical protein VHT75_14915 [Acidimicrobiales bacterium]|jgi:hypothetical protein|nr:hypothetical protein [Acidimicrobiales bacterium]
MSSRVANGRRRLGRVAVTMGVMAVSLGAVVGTSGAGSTAGAVGADSLNPGNLLVSRVVYAGAGQLQAGVTDLPPGCTPGAGGCVKAVSDGTYPYVFNNNTVDSSFGVTAPIFLDELTTGGTVVGSLELPNSTQQGVNRVKDQMVTSFSSKSELALNVSTAGDLVSLMGYLAPVGALDVSNSNTPGVVDPTNPVTEQNYRVVATMDAKGKFRFTETNAYSGNNGRAAIVNDSGSASAIYTAGNAGNGGNPQPVGVIEGTGTQFLYPETKAQVAQRPSDPTALGSFNVTQLGDPIDKVGKDTNFRGLTIANNVVYLTKGSGGNGVNTVYFVDTTGNACPNGGVGNPQPGATLATAPPTFDTNPADVEAMGLTPYNMCVLRGFTTTLAKAKSNNSFPFGVWFANPTTLYVADEGNGTNTFAGGTYTAAAAQNTAGLQKWVLNPTTGVWSRAYTLQTGLNLGQPYTVAGYPTGTNSATGGPWSPATDGLRNITGRVNADGTATIWAVTSTVSGSGDQGADPNKLVAVTDTVGATTLPASESFATVKAAGFGEVLRGVSLTPGR